jgi:hypothetical protein
LSTPTVALSSNTIEEAKKARASKKKLPCDDEAFDRFWKAYPKKQKRLDAQKAWKKLKPDAGLAEQIISDVRRRSQTRDWLKDERKYVPLPTSYLNGRRWEDELPEPKRGDPDWLPTEEEAEVVLQGGGV